MVAVVGGGPAGLMAAEVLAEGGVRVELFDAMPSLGRKFLMAGKGGLNITHSEPFDAFCARYGSQRTRIEPMLAAFDATALRDWAARLGVETFVGSSGRVFPTEKKAAPLLRAWLHRLREAGVSMHVRHRWLGFGDGPRSLRFATPAGERCRAFDAVVLAMGGGSWARLGSDGAWLPILAEKGVPIAPLLPSNCGFDVPWSVHFCERFAGQPVKSVVLSMKDSDGQPLRRQGEFVVTANGVEGSLIYAFSAPLREQILAAGEATIELDLAPGRDHARVLTEVSQPRGSRSISSHLQSKVGIAGVKAGLLRECLPADAFQQPARLAAAIKALPLRLVATRPIDEAISTAGGVRFEGLAAGQMLASVPGVFCAGEMLDWEAPTGGYLLTACFASGRTAGAGVLAWLAGRVPLSLPGSGVGP